MTGLRIGIDLGGTKTEMIALDPAGAELARERWSTPVGDYAATVGGIAARVAATERTTRSGHRCCVTLNLSVDTVDEVEAVYAEIHTLEALTLIF